jgi:hypothetical protein
VDGWQVLRVKVRFGGKMKTPGEEKFADEERSRRIL